MRRLDVILRALPASELSSLIRRMGIRIDPQKRIGAASQAARALSGCPTSATRRAFRRRAASSCTRRRGRWAPGRLLPAGGARAAHRARRGLRPQGRARHRAGCCRPLPRSAAQLGERGSAVPARAAGAGSVRTISAVASHYLGARRRRRCRPRSSSVGDLSDARLPGGDRASGPGRATLLEARGASGEVDTQELLDSRARADAAAGPPV